MKDNWITHNTDKMLLFALVVFLWVTILWAALHIFHHDLDGSMQAVAFISFMTGSFSTVLGALILILTGRTARADGQTGNGLPAVAPPPTNPGGNGGD